MSNLKTEKTALEKEILRMTKRIEELELQIGVDDENLNWSKKFKLIKFLNILSAVIKKYIFS